MIITTEIADKVVERGVQTMYSTGNYRQRAVLSNCKESLSPEICHSAIPNEGVRSKKKRFLYPFHSSLFHSRDFPLFSTELRCVTVRASGSYFYIPLFILRLTYFMTLS